LTAFASVTPIYGVFFDDAAADTARPIANSQIRRHFRDTGWFILFSATPFLLLDVISP